MIDLPNAADDLRAAVAHHQPDLDRVRARVRRRQRRRRAVGAAAAIVLLAAGAASAAAIVGDDRDDSEGVITEPGPTAPDTAPTTPAPADPDPPDEAAPATQLVDYALLRLSVPTGWEVHDAFETGGCGGPEIVVLGEVAPNINCASPQGLPPGTGLRIIAGSVAPDDAASETRNGIPIVGPIVPLVENAPTIAHLPTLGARIEFGAHVDDALIDSVLSSIAPSARHTAMADLESGGLPLWASPTVTWQTVAYGGTRIQVPAGWSVADQTSDHPRRVPGCLSWTTGDSVAVLGGGGECDRGSMSGQPIDGVWLRALAGTEAEGRSAVALGRRIDGATVRVYPGTDNVLEVAIVPDGGGDPLLLRVGLGVDGHVASSIVASIQTTDAATLTLPCGPVVVEDLADLAFPEGLDVDPSIGRGGPTRDETPAPCAVNFTGAGGPARHITFVDGSLPDALDEELGDGRVMRALRWGTVGSGYGAQLRTEDGERTIHVLASGITEAEAEAFFDSLARS